MWSVFKRIDDFTWHYVPVPFKSVIERSSWWKLLLIYSTLFVLVVYRFWILREPLFFHSGPSIMNHPQVDKSTQLKELMIHLLFFFIPMILAFTTRPRQIVQT